MKKFKPGKERCPFCNAIGQCRLFASYYRHIVAFINGKVISSILQIRRVRCSCGHTHAILPDFIVPYRQYTLPFILLILKAWFTHSMTSQEILEAYGISYTVLKKWKDIYGKHKDLWLGIVHSNRLPALGFLEQLLDLDPFSGFTSGFFQKTLYSFLQTHANPANCRQHPPGLASSGSPCT